MEVQYLGVPTLLPHGLHLSGLSYLITKPVALHHIVMLRGSVYIHRLAVMIKIPYESEVVGIYRGTGRDGTGTDIASRLPSFRRIPDPSADSPRPVVGPVVLRVHDSAWPLYATNRSHVRKMNCVLNESQ